MHHGGEELHRLVCFLHSSPASAKHPPAARARSPAIRTENSHSSIKSLFSSLLHNILFNKNQILSKLQLWKIALQFDGDGDADGGRGRGRDRDRDVNTKYS